MGLAGTAVRRIGGTAVQRRVGAPAQLVQSFVQEPVDYSEEQYSSGGNSYMGLGRFLVPAAGNVVNYTVKPNRPINPFEFRFPSTVVGIMIEGVSMLGLNFLANEIGQGMPIELFSEVARIKGFDARTINPETGITFALSTYTGVDKYFMGAIRGTQVLP